MERDTRICFKCEWENPVHARFCEFCNASLPVIKKEETSKIDFLEKNVYSKIVDVGWNSPKYKKLLEAGENMINSTISRAEFKKIVDNLHDNIIEELYGDDGVRKNLKNYVREENTEKAEEITDMCLDALYTYDDAFDEIKLYFQDSQNYHIEEGLKMALDAKNKLLDALEILDKNSGEYGHILKKLE